MRDKLTRQLLQPVRPRLISHAFQRCIDDFLASPTVFLSTLLFTVSYLFRSLGSVVGLAVGSAILQDVLRVILHRTLTGKDVNEIVRHVKESLSYLDELDSETRAIVLSAYEEAIRMTMFFSLSMALCAVFASLFIKEKELSRRN